MEISEFILHVFLLGVGATALLDLWAILAQRLFGLARPNWAMVGRWIGHFRDGRWSHDSIAQADAVTGERLIGWSAHYAIGMIFAALLLAWTGPEWARQPTLLPALLIGIATVAAPFFIMQPAMGAGIAASKSPNRNRARTGSLLAHIMFGLGLYFSACIVAALIG